MDRITTGETALLSMGSFASFDEFYNRWLIPTMAKRIGKVVKLNDIADMEIEAVINHSRYVARCPFCTGAELVWPSRLVFMCCSCWNEQAGNKFLRVKLPEKREGIERELLNRPQPHTRNWEPGESIARLRRENKQHGVK